MDIQTQGIWRVRRAGGFTTEKPKRVPGLDPLDELVGTWADATREFGVLVYTALGLALLLLGCSQKYDAHPKKT